MWFNSEIRHQLPKKKNPKQYVIFVTFIFFSVKYSTDMSLRENGTYKNEGKYSKYTV